MVRLAGAFDDVAASVGVRVEGWWPSAPVAAPPTSDLLVWAFVDRGGANLHRIHALTFIGRAELEERVVSACSCDPFAHR